MTPSIVGSPPHTRGARRRGGDTERCRGITPAYAGSTRGDGSSGPRSPDHPRIRGEHFAFEPFAAAAFGSPPHTRGAPALGGHGRHPVRITPAYAGSTSVLWSTCDLDGDHPRIRGEHRFVSSSHRIRNGSPPHTRGAPGTGCSWCTRSRITPAYAGSTESAGASRTPTPDHPRIRGEHEGPAVILSLEPGSPPHTRGAPPGSDTPRRRRGITPAYAGSTASCHLPTGYAADHPRIRGEHGLLAPKGVDQTGSPPHTRGALHDCRTDGGPRRITPAYAGSTHGPRTDHTMLRITPAYAGSTS